MILFLLCGKDWLGKTNASVSFADIIPEKPPLVKNDIWECNRLLLQSEFSSKLRIFRQGIKPESVFPLSSHKGMTSSFRSIKAEENPNPFVFL